jgi:TPP-dependent pyruvate/acetoin dehydrogenase alpha subunit
MASGLQLSRDELAAAYRRMRTIRTFEDTVHAEFAAGNIPGFVHLYAGEEASGVGVCMHLDDRDAIASTHRGHGHCIAKGCDLRGMMAEIYGREDGLCKGKGGSMHIADFSRGMLGANAIVGGGIAIDVDDFSLAIRVGEHFDLEGDVHGMSHHVSARCGVPGCPRRVQSEQCFPLQ